MNHPHFLMRIDARLPKKNPSLPPNTWLPFFSIANNVGEPKPRPVIKAENGPGHEHPKMSEVRGDFPMPKDVFKKTTRDRSELQSGGMFPRLR